MFCPDLGSQYYEEETDGGREARPSWKTAGEDSPTAARNITQTGKTAVQTVIYACMLVHVGVCV